MFPTRIRLAHAAVASTALIIAAACAGGRNLPNTLPSYMYEHFGTLGDVQTAIILGDLDRAREGALWLERNSTHPDLPAEGIAELERFRWHAGQLARSESLGGAAGSAANMAGACGSCHATVGGGPRLSLEATPPPAESTGLHMNRHLWAADRMWEGLIGPSEDLWEIGAGALGDDPLEMAAQGASTNQVFADRVHDIGRRALDTVDHEDRIDLYGQLLATCSGCHGRSGN